MLITAMAPAASAAASRQTASSPFTAHAPAKESSAGRAENRIQLDCNSDNEIRPFEHRPHKRVSYRILVSSAKRRLRGVHLITQHAYARDTYLHGIAVKERANSGGSAGSDQV